MKIFIIKVFCFAAVVCVVFFGIENVLEFISDDDYQYKHNYLINHLNDIKILALGHSHIADGINMIALNDSGFNTAIPGRNMFYDAEIIKEFVPKMPNLKTVILPLGYNFQYITEINDQQKCLMAKYWNYILPGESPFIHLESLYGSKYKITHLLFPKVSNLYFDTLGHQHLPQNANKNWLMANLPKFVPKNSDNTRFVSEIKEIARICRDYNIRLITLTMPCYETYIARTTSQGIVELHAMADSMRAIYPEMEYYDFMGDKRFEHTDFFDSSHLNEIGALKFTSILKNEILYRQDSLYN